MYNHKLDTFATVIDSGSFTKAAEVLFVSPTAIMKQMNTLERELDLILLERTHSGVRATLAGQSIYQNIPFLKEYSQKCIMEASALSQQFDTTFCVGTSLLNPAKPFMDVWYKINHDFSEYKLHLIPFDDNSEDIVSIVKSLGVNFDFLIGVCDSKTWLSFCNFLPLGNYKKMVAMNRGHALARKSHLTLEDLNGETLMMVKSGDSSVNDTLREDLKKNHPKISIEDTPHFYDLSVFNACAESQKLLLTIECWENVHPGLITLPVEWDYTIPFGILYSLDPPKDIFKLIEQIANSKNSK